MSSLAGCALPSEPEGTPTATEYVSPTDTPPTTTRYTPLFEVENAMNRPVEFAISLVELSEDGEPTTETYRLESGQSVSLDDRLETDTAY